MLHRYHLCDASYKPRFVNGDQRSLGHAKMEEKA